MAATSSNLVKIKTIKESSYGVTPSSGNFKSPRFTSEDFSGTPQTVQSALLRSDRLSSGQILTGIEVGGTLTTELSAESVYWDFIESAMFSEWGRLTTKTVNGTIDAGAKTITRSTGSFITDGFKVGDLIQLAGYSDDANNGVRMFIVDLTATVLTYFTNATILSETGSASNRILRDDRIEIGTSLKSLSIERQLTDLQNKGINYKGMVVNAMNLNFEWGELVTCDWEFMGNSFMTYNFANQSISNNRGTEDQSSAQVLNGSVDLDFVGVDYTATGFVSNNLDIEKLSISLNNNLNPKNVIGERSPVDFSGGTAQIEIQIMGHIKDANWNILQKKIDQGKIKICGLVHNASGGYGFYMPAVQLTFQDPHSKGQNENVMLEMTGTASVGENGEKSLILSEFTAS